MWLIIAGSVVLILAIIPLVVVLYRNKIGEKQTDKQSRRFGYGIIRNGFQVAYRTESHRNVMGARFKKLNGTERKSLKLYADEVVTFHYDFRIETGNLFAELLSPDGSALTAFGKNTSGSKEIKISTSGSYKVEVKADHASGSYRIEFTIR